MTTTTFTTRIDLGLKRRLEQVAERDKRSASFIANQATLSAKVTSLGTFSNPLW